MPSVTSAVVGRWNGGSGGAKPASSRKFAGEASNHDYRADDVACGGVSDDRQWHQRLEKSGCYQEAQKDKWWQGYDACDVGRPCPPRGR
jgi:hypothetical protein